MTGIGTAFLDAYINTNILILFAYLLWWAIKTALPGAGLRHANALQLRLLNWTFLIVLVCPFLALGARLLSEPGGEGTVATLNISDAVLAYYLNGGFQMKPIALESILDLRQQFTNDLLTLATPMAKAVAAVFAAGVALTAGRLALGLWRLADVLAGSFRWRRFGTVDLRLSDTISVPFSARGLTRRYVVIPSGLLGNAQDLRMVLSHEFQHLRQRDVEWESFLELLRPLFFWNPGFALWKREVERLRELACDEQILQRDRFSARAYGLCLLRVSRDSLAKSQNAAPHHPTVAFMGRGRYAGHSHDLLYGRIIAITSRRKASQSSTLFLALLGVLTILTVTASFAIQRSPDWSHDRLMLSTIINLERIEEINNSLSGSGI